jgi:flagellar basal-body rod modification protein FlgD
MANITGIGASFTATAADTAAPTRQEEISKDLFLKLMVAQLKNQNPLNPVDGVDFLMQLSQISSVEQMVEMKSTLSSIHELLQQMTAPPSE